MKPTISVILPANNESEYIGACLEHLLKSNWQHPDDTVEIIVVGNACTDDTINISRAFDERFRAKGWHLKVLDLPQSGKLFALNAGDDKAGAGIRVYLDADVLVDADLMSQIYDALNRKQATYCSGKIQITSDRSLASRAYRRFYACVPFMTTGTPGCGLFAVNAAGRTRWGKFPNIISDDTFVRLQFDPSERIMVEAGYQWPIVEGFRNLIRVRRRQDLGVHEISRNYPEILKNNDRYPSAKKQLFEAAIRYPIGFLVYASVAICVRITGTGADEKWDRGR